MAVMYYETVSHVTAGRTEEYYEHLSQDCRSLAGIRTEHFLNTSRSDYRCP